MNFEDQSEFHALLKAKLHVTEPEKVTHNTLIFSFW